MGDLFSNIEILDLLIYIIYLSILICSVLSLAFVIERFIFLRRVKLNVNSLFERVKKSVEAGMMTKAISICENETSPISSLIKSGLKKYDHSRDIIKESIEDAANAEIPKLERFLPALSTISTIAPLLGLLGTVVGMIDAFEVIALQGTGDPHALAGGISQALLTTAAGLIVAIPTVITYNYFTNRVNNFISEMEFRSGEIVDILTESKGGSEKISKWHDS